MFLYSPMFSNILPHPCASSYNLLHPSASSMRPSTYIDSLLHPNTPFYIFLPPSTSFHILLHPCTFLCSFVFSTIATLVQEKYLENIGRSQGIHIMFAWSMHMIFTFAKTLLTHRCWSVARCQRGRWSQSLANNKLAALVSQPTASPTSNKSTGVLIFPRLEQKGLPINRCQHSQLQKKMPHSCQPIPHSHLQFFSNSAVPTSSTYIWQLRKRRVIQTCWRIFSFQHETIVNILGSRAAARVFYSFEILKCLGITVVYDSVGFYFLLWFVLFASCTFQALLPRLKCRGCSNCLPAGLLVQYILCHDETGTSFPNACP